MTISEVQYSQSFDTLNCVYLPLTLSNITNDKYLLSILDSFDILFIFKVIRYLDTGDGQICSWQEIHQSSSELQVFPLFLEHYFKSCKMLLDPRWAVK